MFERYTDKARRTVFFARYEASTFASRMIEPEHLLVGLLREDAALRDRTPPDAAERIRKQLQERIPLVEPRRAKG
jgi:ATP-dependent Clp protease ATP-binding subunit ClpC